MEIKTKKTIKDLPKVERPREKLMQYGPEKLSNSELLAILLRSGKKGENVIELANKILKKFSKDELPNLTFNDLKDYSGLGPAKACEIVACFELGKRLLKDKKAEITKKNILLSSILIAETKKSKEKLFLLVRLMLI